MPAMSDTLVRVEHVSKKFCRNLRRSLWYGVRDLGNELVGRQRNHETLRQDEFWAVDDVSFELKRGECLGLIGSNGAGKTTLLRMLNGLITPDRGRIEMRGRVGALIALGAGFNPILSGRENVYVNAAVLGLTKRETDRRFDEIVEFSGLEEFIDSPVQQYSSGMQVRLGFAVAAHLEPDILLVDEALAVGDLAYVIKCVNRIAELRHLGTGVIFVTHNELQVREVAQRCLLLQKGKTKCAGTPEDVFSVYGAEPDGETRFEAGLNYVPDGPVHLVMSGGIEPVPVGETCTFSIFCRASKAVADADFELRFWNSAGQLVSTIATARHGRFGLSAGRTIISIRIRQMTLAPGKYRLAGGFRRKGEVLGWVRDLANLEVVAPRTPWIGTGLAMLDATIDHRRDTQELAWSSAVNDDA